MMEIMMMVTMVMMVACLVAWLMTMVMLMMMLMTLKIVLLAAVAMIMVVMMMIVTIDDDHDDDAKHVRTSDRKGAFPSDLLAMRGKPGKCGNSPSTCRQFAFVVNKCQRKFCQAAHPSKHGAPATYG